jgi:hypothetical protein
LAASRIVGSLTRGSLAVTVNAPSKEERHADHFPQKRLEPKVPLGHVDAQRFKHIYSVLLVMYKQNDRISCGLSKLSKEIPDLLCDSLRVADLGLTMWIAVFVPLEAA